MVQMLTHKLQVWQTLSVVQPPPKAARSVLTPACLSCTEPNKARSMGLERMSAMKLGQRARMASIHVVLC
jgi:hypothetical protein